MLGPRVDKPDAPDIAIEVVWTSGRIDKLDVDRGLGVPEVWIWKNAALRTFILQGHAYLPSARRRLLPDLDPALLARRMGESSQTQAVRTYRAALKSLP